MQEGVDDQVAEGWARYLADVQSANDSYNYEVLEQAAWDRLLAHLEAIGKPLKRRKGKVKV